MMVRLADCQSLVILSRAHLLLLAMFIGCIDIADGLQVVVTFSLVSD
jgi:hypothetical protein